MFCNISEGMATIPKATQLITLPPSHSMTPSPTCWDPPMGHLGRGVLYKRGRPFQKGTSLENLYNPK